MGNQVRKLGYFAVMVFLFCMAPAALAQNTASMTLTGAGNNVLGGVYVGPYTATIDGVSTQVICDDWQDESDINETWTANVNTLSPLSNPGELKWGNNQLLYDQVGWLINQMLAPPATCPAGGTCDIVGDISFALWELTYCSVNSCPSVSTSGTPFANLSGNDLTNAENWLSAAEKLTSSSFTAGEFSSWTIYTPSPGPPPQEFITTPESPTLLLLGTDLFGLVALVVVLRRRIVRTAS